MNNMEVILKEMSYQFDNMASKYDLMVKKGRLGDNNDADLRIRMDQSLRQMEEHNHIITTDLINRMSGLENRLANEERVKGQLKEKLMIAEQNFKEISNFIQTFQKLDNSEINQMRILIQDKISEDQQLFMKEREKSKALFNEIVRIGELQEKQAKDIYSFNSDFDARMRGMESKFILSEQTMNQLITKGETGITYMSEWNEKLDGRIQQLETNLIGLGKEQMKDRDSIVRMEALNQKITDDLKQLLAAMQTDYQTRLDSKITEVLNRIIIEHEERKRSEEDLRHQMDIRTKLQEEKINYEKEEMRDRYMAMDSLVRAEFQRKEESIRSLGELVENNIKRIQTAIKQEEITRDQFEAAMRIEMQKMHEILNKDLEFFKSQFALENEKLTEIVKGEIDTRFSSDVELKNLTNLMLTSITTEINEFKSAVEKQNKIFASELKEVSHDSSERDAQLSKFVEMETKKVLDTSNGKYDKLKYLVTRIAEQFKAHLKTFEKSSQDLRTDIQDNTIKLNDVYGDLNKNIGSIESKIVDKISEVTSKLQKDNDVRFKLAEDFMKKLNEKQKSDFEILKDALEKQGDIHTEKIDKMAEVSEQYHKSNFLNLKMLVAELDKIRASLYVLDQELENKWQEQSNKSVKRRDFDEYLESYLNELQKIMDSTIAEVESRFNDTYASITGENDRVKAKMNKLEEKDKEIMTRLTEGFDNTKKQWVKVMDDMNSANAYIKTVELMTRTLSTRTYSDFNEFFTVIENVQKMVTEEKQCQIKEAEGIRKILFDLNKRVDVELPEHINASVMKVLEEVKEENIKIWEVCLTYAQKADSKTQKVGGKDSYQLPLLGESPVDIEAAKSVNNDTVQDTSQASKTGKDKDTKASKDAKGAKDGKEPKAPPTDKKAKDTKKQDDDEDDDDDDDNEDD